MAYFALGYRILYHDTMALGWQHFLTSFKFQCEAREHFFFRYVLGDDPRCELQQTMGLLTQQAYSRVLGSARVGERVGIVMSAEAPSRSSFRFCFRVVRADGEPVACGFQTIVATEHPSGRVIELPSALVSWGATILEKVVAPSFAERVQDGLRYHELLDKETVALGVRAATSDTPIFSDPIVAKLGRPGLTPGRRLTAILLPGTGSATPKALQAAGASSDGRAVIRAAEDVARDLLQAPKDCLVSPPSSDDQAFGRGEWQQLASYVLAVLQGRAALERRPDMLVGHSAGEIAALAVAEAFDMQAGLQILAGRARALRQARGVGGLLAVHAAAKRVTALLEGGGYKKTRLALVNSPVQCVVSGPHDELGKLGGLLEAAGIRATRLDTPHPFHSALLADYVAPFREALRGVSTRAPSIPVYSPLERQFYAAETDLAEVLPTHLVRPLDFQESVEGLYRLGVERFLDSGSGVLSAFVRATLPKEVEAAPIAGAETAAMPAASVATPAPAKAAALAATPSVVPVAAPADAPPDSTPFRVYEPSLVPSPAPSAAGFSLAEKRVLVALSNPRDIDAPWLAELAKVASVKIAVAGPATPRQDVVAVDVSSEAAAQSSLALLASWPCDVLVAAQDLADVPASPTAIASAETSLAFMLTRSAYARLESGAVRFAALSLNAVRDGKLHPASGLFGGFVKALARELPQGICSAVALDSADPTQVRESLAQALAAPAGPAESVRIAGRTHHVALREVRRLSKGAPLVDEGSVVVMSGGARGVTAELAEELLRRTGCTVVLLGRKAPAASAPEGEAEFYARRRAEEPQRSIKELRAELVHLQAAREVASNLERLSVVGGRVEYRAVDVRSPAAVKAVLAGILERFGKIDMVVHGAGVQSSKRLSSKSLDDFRDTVDTKLGGLANLWRACDELGAGPTHFHLLSSSFSHFGNPGQPDYGAANEALNRLAAYQDGDQRFSWSVLAWPGWRGVGMTQSDEYAALARRLQLPGLAVAEGRQIFAAVFAGRPAHAVNMVLSDSEFKRFAAPVPSYDAGDERSSSPLPIALTAAGCVLPGALGTEALWRALLEKRTAVTAHTRFDMKPFTGAAGTVEPDKAYTSLGGWIQGFEPGIDQQLGRTWTTKSQSYLAAALQQCLAADPVPQTARVHCYLGVTSDGSADLDEATVRQLVQGGQPEDACDLDVARGHEAVVRHALGDDVRCISVDGACASSLVAIDLAVQALRAGDCDVAVVGGVFAPGPAINCLFSQFRGLSSTGSRPLDASADGVVFGEGAALVVLRRLPEAEAAGDHIYAVIRGIAGSSDGRGASVMEPRPGGQLRALERAWRSAGLDPASVQFIEAHATATPVGDRVEIGALNQFFASTRDVVEVQSVKASLGHTGWVAGVASLIKVAWALDRRVIPPQAGLVQPCDGITKGPARLTISTEPRPWPANEHSEPRRAAINGFGFGGTNVHLVVDGYERASRSHAGVQPPEELVVVAHSLLVPRDGARFDASELAPPKHLRILPDAADAMDRGQFLALRAADAVLAQLGDAASSAKADIGVVLGVQGKTAASWQVGPRLYADKLRAEIGEAGVVELLRGTKPTGPYTLAGTMPNLTSGRVANMNDLGGLNFVVDAGQASLYEALQQAGSLLQSGECRLVLAGGVSAPGATPMAQFYPDAQGRPCRETAVVVALTTARLAKSMGLPIVARLETRAATGPDCRYPLATGVNAMAASGAEELIEALKAGGEISWGPGRTLAVKGAARVTTNLSLSVEAQPFLRQHLVKGVPTVPAAYLMYRSLATLKSLHPHLEPTTVLEARFDRFIKLHDHRPANLRVHVDVRDTTACIVVTSDFMHKSGRLLQKDVRHFEMTVALAGRALPGVERPAANGSHYALAADPYVTGAGALRLDGAFRCLFDIKGSPNQRWARYSCSPETPRELSDLPLPVLLLDAVFRVSAMHVGQPDHQRVYAPISCRNVQVYSPDPATWREATIVAGPQRIVGDEIHIGWAAAYDPNGALLLQVQDLNARVLETAQPGVTTQHCQPCEVSNVHA